jgi:glycine cleavage system H protein
VVAVNPELDNAPEKINTEPYSAWMFKMKPDNAADVDELMDAAAYQTLVDNEAH